MAGPTHSDPLAETAAAEGSDSGARGVNATATGVPSEPSIPRAPGTAPTAIGRYHIVGQLGQGAMGVVYAAQDPDLERRIALKVLRGTDSETSRARLLREARAMARLSHPAVVTVHEVGTAGGVDYVAMELIDGSTVAEWVQSAKPSADEVLDVFETAGRGLAAAHAAGLVHRDFKPHNVLRSKRGRVVVTDFGLARAALDEPLAETVPGGGAPRDAATTDAGSLSSTLTATGALLGTPAYMAPEQHDGAAVGAAADQFAYCVAVWEALAGSRPFPGQTLATVRQQISRGPDPAGEAKIPRRLRPVLRRGLAVDPADRFPTMDALLAAIRRKRAARVWAIAGAIAVVVAAAVVLIVVRTGAKTPAALPGCGPADTELAGFRRDPMRAKLSSDAGRRAVGQLDRAAGAWAEIQPGVCAHRADPEHARRVTCLRAIRGHLEAALDALGELSPDELALADPAMIGGDPKACAAAAGPPTRVVIEHDAREVAVIAALLGDKARRDAAADPGDAAPCLRGTLLMARLTDFEQRPHEEVRTFVGAASEAADRCGDDRLAASITLLSLSTDFASLTQDPGQTRRIAAAIERSRGDRYLVGVAELIEGVMATFRSDMDSAITHMSAAADQAKAIGSRTMQSGTSLMAARWLFARSAPGDMAAAEQRARDGLALAGPHKRPDFQNLLIGILQAQGRGPEAQQVLAGRDDPDETTEAAPGSIAITGRLVDAAGKPVAGARVVAQARLVIYPDQFDPTSPTICTAVTAADGTFAIGSAPPKAVVMASIDSRYSMPVPVAARVELKLTPTGSVFGQVTTIGTGLGRVEVAVEPMSPFDVIDYTAPIAADGSWRIDGVPRGKAKVVIASGIDQRKAQFTDVTVGAAPVGPIALEAAQRGIPIQVIVRSQVQIPLSLGIAIVIPGKFTAKVLSDFDNLKTGLLQARAYPINIGEAPEVVRGTIESGDVLTRVPAVEPGELTVCGFGITGELADNEYMRRIDRHARELGVTCTTTTVTKPEQVIVVEVPPMKRMTDD